MNILDGVSYGLSACSSLVCSVVAASQDPDGRFSVAPTVMFPPNLPEFAGFGGIGVSMFFVSCVVSQVVYTGGGSIFKGALSRWNALPARPY